MKFPMEDTKLCIGFLVKGEDVYITWYYIAVCATKVHIRFLISNIYFKYMNPKGWRYFHSGKYDQLNSRGEFYKHTCTMFFLNMCVR